MGESVEEVGGGLKRRVSEAGVDVQDARTEVIRIHDGILSVDFVCFDVEHCLSACPCLGGCLFSLEICIPYKKEYIFGLFCSGLFCSGLVWAGLVWAGLGWAGLVWAGYRLSRKSFIPEFPIRYVISSLVAHRVSSISHVSVGPSVGSVWMWCVISKR